VILASKYEERWDYPASCVDSCDQRYPLAIAWLDSLWPASPLRPCYDKLGRDLAHHKASFVEVVDVLVTDTILGLSLRADRNYLECLEWLETIEDEMTKLRTDAASMRARRASKQLCVLL
jgi:hypothetical protein